MKSKILNILRKEKRIVSGETLSRHLKISRVSIWKHIGKLKEFGYQIESTPKGYRLISSPDVLYPWEFPGRESKIHYFEEIESTMDIAKNLARNDCPDFTVVIAGSQNRGRGRLKRTWLSSAGGLYFTIVLRPQMPPVLSSRVGFAAAMILAKTLRRRFDIEAVVKWPNDILVDGKKISGMLSEMEAEADMVSFINIGIGINVNNDPGKSEPMATSLRNILGRKIPKKPLLSGFLNEFESYINSSDLDLVVSEWKKYSVTLNSYVKIITGQEVSEGFALDVDENGALLLRLDNGSIKKILHGDCFHVDI
jgi:BirA family biotin operon repressor/biotin-[acetyl-CoA-carboxylase] ligase